MSNTINLSSIESFSSSLEECIKSAFLKKGDVLETLNYAKTKKYYTRNGEKLLEKLIKELSGSIEVVDLLVDSNFVELLSFHCLKKIADKLNFTIEYKLGSTTFPDITLIDTDSIKYGFEIKRVSGDTVLGNSSTQSINGIENLKKIYAISFFNDGDTIHISNYEDLIFDIDVDHNPRFRLKLHLEDQGNFKEIFSEGNLIQYYSLGQEEREKIVANYLRKKYENDENRWFLGQSTTIIEEFLTELKNIKLDREKIRIYVFCNFPSIFSMTNYNTIRKVIMKKYKYLGAVKDIFTAGGKDNGFPRIYAHLITLLPQIEEQLTILKINKTGWIGELKSSITAAGDLNKKKEKELCKLIDKHII